jgi:hypothetical protein
MQTDDVTDKDYANDLVVVAAAVVVIKKMKEKKKEGKEKW